MNEQSQFGSVAPFAKTPFVFGGTVVVCIIAVFVLFMMKNDIKYLVLRIVGAEHESFADTVAFSLPIIAAGASFGTACWLYFY